MSDKLKVFASRVSTPLVLYSRGSLADSLLQLSFVLALLSLNLVLRGFSVSLIWLLYVRWRRLDFSRWPNLACRRNFARWRSTLFCGSVELASSINIPQWHFTKVHSRGIGNKNKYNSQEQVKTTLMPQSLRATIGPLQENRGSTTFPLRQWNLGNLTLQTCLSITRDFSACIVLSHGSMMLPPRQPWLLLLKCTFWTHGCFVRNI